MKATAADGLAASVRNEKAYRTAATQMVAACSPASTRSTPIVLEVGRRAGVDASGASAAP